MQDGSNPKQLIAEKIKQSANILVTVSANPSVDSLTAALALSLMLNKLDKHVTAVFSGAIPPAISFLEPNKTFENNVDSLRDFIIALDKDKADRLRYKVEDDVVRIFITPYRTRISEKDLQFSQGDFNVDLIVALGVEDQRDLDQAITAHGRILHDASVVTINASGQKSALGSIDWQDGKSSSLSEMLVSLAELLKQGILDQQISTALLTGIVASTGRFSNQKTTPHAMTVAAQLMASGANQQLIASRLQTIPAPVSPRREKPGKPQNASTKIQPDEKRDSDALGEMQIQHEQQQPVEPVAPAEAAIEEPPVPEPMPEPPEPQPEPELAIVPPPAQTFDDLKQSIQEETARAAWPQREMVVEPPAPGSRNSNADNLEGPALKSDEESYLTSHPSWQGREIEPPTMGGTLSATAEQALEDKIRSERDDRNRTILTHDGTEAPVAPPPAPKQKQKRKNPAPPSVPSQQAPMASTPKPEPVLPAEPQPEPEVPPPPPIEPLAPPAPLSSVELPAEALAVPPAPESAPAPEPAPPVPEMTPPPAPVTPPAPAVHEPTLEELEREAALHAAQAAAPQTLSDLEAARQQVVPATSVPSPALGEPALTSPSTPMPGPGELSPLPPMPDFSTLPPIPGAPAPAPELPSLPPQPPTAAPPQVQTQTPPQPAGPPDPSQYRIPGQ